MEELIEEFADDAVRRIERLWGESHVSLADRLKMQLEEFRRFYLRFNPNPGDRNVWSPLSRLRLDLLILGTRPLMLWHAPIARMIDL